MCVCDKVKFVYNLYQSPVDYNKINITIIII